MAQKITHLTPRGSGDSQPAPHFAPALHDHDATLPPTPLKKLLAADGAAVYVLSADSGLMDAVTTAGGEQFPIQHVPTFKALRSLVDSGDCRIALLDAEPFGSALRARIAELKGIEPELVVIVAAPREVAEDLMGLFSERVIHRLLIKPPAIGITRLLLESAVSRFLQIREAHETTSSEPIIASRRAFGTYVQSSRSAWFLAIALVTVLVAGIVIGGFVNVGGSDDANTPQGAQTEPFAAAIDAPPAPANAVAGTSIATETAAETTPDSGPAATELSETPVSTVVESESSESADIEGARDAATDADSGPGSEIAAGLVVGAALAAGSETSDEGGERRAASTVAETAGRAPITAPAVASPPSELESLLLLGRSRLQRGQVLEPSGDSARDYIERAFALDSENRDVLAMRAEIGAAVADSARVVLGSGEIERAAALTEQARRLGAPNETLALLSVDIAAARAAAAARAQGRLLATGIERMEQDQLVAPEDDSALFYLQRLRTENADYPGLETAWRDLGVLLTRHAETAIAERNWVEAESWIATLAGVVEPATIDAVRADLAAAVVRLQEEYLATPARSGELRVVTVGQARYPEEAVRRGVDGWVDAEFVVGIDGVPRDARVVVATPPRTFEDAALAAVALYRYEPFERDGRVYERLVRVRIRFDLQ